MEPRRVENWDGLIREFEHLTPGWVFRGMADARWQLKTSLERHTPVGVKSSEAERTLLREFRRRAHTYLQSSQVPQDTGEWLALMQHFGAPSRLLDVTRSPYVATYFAVEDAVDGAQHFAVWALNKGWWIRTVGSLVLRDEPELRNSLEFELAKQLIGEEVDPETLQGILESTLGVDAWLGEQKRRVIPFEPERLSERLSIQQGEFMVPRDVDASFMDNLDAMGDSGANVIKFEISVEERPRALQQLRLMNITRASLFPGLEGFAQSFRQVLIDEPWERRKRRLIRSALLGELRKTMKQREDKPAEDMKPPREKQE